MKGDLSLKLLPHPTRVQNGKHQLVLRLTLHRKKVEFFLKHYVPAEDIEGFLRRNTHIDQDVAQLKANIYRVKRRLEDEGTEVTAALIKQALTAKVAAAERLTDYFDQHISRISANKREYTDENVAKYAKTAAYVKEFIAKHRHKKDPLLREVDYKFLSDFDHYLITTYQAGIRRTLSRNTVNQHHTRLRTILLKAVREGLITQSPYINFKLKDEAQTPRFLTDDELQQIIAHPLGDNASLKRVRDVFIFSVYTGLRFSDAMKVRITDVRQDKEGEFHIFVEKQEKTNEPLAIPVFAPVLDIIRRYDDAERKVTGMVLPRMSNQKVNTYLKTIADLVGLDKKLTHHVARHTCATTVLLSNGASLEATGHWLGQKSIKSTQIYAKVTNQLLKATAKKIADKI